jgi:hypothetical protein
MDFGSGVCPSACRKISCQTAWMLRCLEPALLQGKCQ